MVMVGYTRITLGVVVIHGDGDRSECVIRQIFQEIKYLFLNKVEQDFIGLKDLSIYRDLGSGTLKDLFC